MFWKALVTLRQWERENLPSGNTLHGTELLAWLLEDKSVPRPLKSLYRSSQYSEPTMRACLQEFVERGLVVIEFNAEDMRTRVARGTPKFQETVLEYQALIKAVAAQDDED